MTHVAPLKILKASAGSGKTFSLTLHYITLLLSNENSYREILAVTFTNKATAEMKERILFVLEGLAQGDTQRKINDFRELLLKNNPKWNPQIIQQKAYHVFRKIIHDYGNFTVSTIDGFSQKVIRSFTYELNLDSAYKIEMNTNKVKKDLTIMLNQVLDNKPDLLEWIITYAEKKINNNENWNYRTQLNALAGLIFSENFQEFDSALASRKDEQIFKLLDQEIFEKIDNYIQSLKLAIESFQETFKSLAIDPADMKGKSRNPLISASKISPSQVNKITIGDLIKLLEKYTRLHLTEEGFLDSKKNLRVDLQNAFNPVLTQFVALENLLPNYIGYSAVQGNLYYLRLLKEMSDLLSVWRKENAAQLISDSQILLSKLGIDAHNDPTFIWEKIGNRYNYFLFDEFQDTSRIQWKNYSPLLLNALSNFSGELSEHLIVGDVKQSIYRWRNGDWRILLQQVEEQIKENFHLDQHTIKEFIENGSLESNYRSLPNIIRFNNYLFKTIPHHMQKVLNETAEQELTAEGLAWWKEAQNDSMLIRAYESSEQKIPENKLTEHAPQGSIEIEYIQVEDNRYRAKQAQQESTDKLCDKIGQWISSGRYKANQIGILVRSNAQAMHIIQSLMEYKNSTGIDFDVISGDALSLQSNDAVNLILETLKSFVYTSDKHVIHHARMAYLYHIIIKHKPFHEDVWLDFKSNDIESLQHILPEALITNWHEWLRLPLIHLVEKLIEAYGFSNENNVHLPYILTFKDIVSNFTSNGERGINQFLEFWEEDGHKAVLPASGKVNAIEVTTVHKSKGLAYEVVMIPYCSWTLDGFNNGDFWIDTQNTPFWQLSRIPIKYNAYVGKSIFYKQYFEEKLFNYMDSLNTLYVATTRAIEHLYITAPFFAEKEDKKIGQYIDVKNELISDIVYQVLDNHQSPFKMEDKKVSLDLPIQKQKQPEQDQQIIALEKYPLSKAMEKALDKDRAKNLSVSIMMMLDKASQYGILAHQIMAEANSLKDVDSIISTYVQQGELTRIDQITLEAEIYRVWKHPKIKKWLKGNYKIWNEAAIIMPNGKTLRPDKVFTNDKETIILDFKFTEEDYIEHKAQVADYMNALAELGYKNIKGYLFYAKTDQLTQVI